MKIDSPLVSVDWLKRHLTNSNLILLDATLEKVTESAANENREYITTTRIFDIKTEFSALNAPFPNTMLSPQAFEKKAQELGINSTSLIVIYDRYGIYSSARAWWMFKSMGHEQVAVLNGGLPAWKDKNYPIKSHPESNFTMGNFTVNPQINAFVSYHDVLKAIKDDTAIVDARAEDRFMAIVKEPRAGLRSGHIPSSKNLPYTHLLVEGKFLSPEELLPFFSSKQKTIFTCGSGVTACILALAATLAGHKDISVYDGSWTEWGSLNELPISSGEKR